MYKLPDTACMKHACTAWLFRVRKQTWPTWVAKNLVVLGHRGGETEVKRTCDRFWGFWLLYFLSWRLVQGLSSELHMLESGTFWKLLYFQWKSKKVKPGIFNILLLCARVWGMEMESLRPYWTTQLEGSLVYIARSCLQQTLQLQNGNNSDSH